MNVSPSRLYFIDNIRWLMIILVVLMHVNVTYGMLGSWYYVEKSNLDLFQQIWFGMYGSFTQAYFMGFLFFIAGYFVPASYDKKGFGRFIKERLIRLGVPTLLFVFILHPITIFIMGHFFNWNMNYVKYYTEFISTGEFVRSTGPLWFALALLIFTLAYALFRKISGSKPLSPDSVHIKHKHIIWAGLLIAALTFLVRIPYPIGSSVLNMQLCFFSQYIILFMLGIYFYRKNLLLTINYTTGMKWFKYTLIFGTIFWFAMSVIAKVDEKGVAPIAGGFTWGNAAYAFWESFFCVGVCLGLIVWFREKMNRQGRLSRILSDNAFGVYVFHTPILVLISLLLKDVVLYPFYKYLIVAAITIPLCFAVSYLLRKIPGVSTIIK